MISIDGVSIVLITHIKPGFGFLVTLVAEMPVDPLNHCYRRSRHSGDQEHVHASHEHLADPEVAEPEP